MFDEDRLFSLPVRIALIFIASTVGSYLVAKGELIGYGLIAAAVIFAVGYFRYGPIRPAFMALQRQQFDKAQRLADTIKFPNLLGPEARAYYYWIQAVLSAQDDDNLNDAEEQMAIAIAGPLRTDNDRCVATATLAQIVFRNNEPDRALKILDDAMQIHHKDEVNTYLEQIKNEFEDSKY